MTTAIIPTKVAIIQTSTNMIKNAKQTKIATTKIILNTEMILLATQLAALKGIINGLNKIDFKTEKIPSRLYILVKWIFFINNCFKATFGDPQEISTL